MCEIIMAHPSYANYGQFLLAIRMTLKCNVQVVYI